MATTNTALQNAFTPEDYGKLVDAEITDKAVAFQAATVVNTGKHQVRFPILVTDPETGWYAENTPITLVDPVTNEVVVVPTKVAGLTQVSNESVEDTDPAVAAMIGKALARDIGKKVDAAFFGDTVTHGPSGLLSVQGVQVVDTTAGWTTLDYVHDAKSKAMANGAELTHIVLAPDVALALSKAKTASGSNQGLIESVDDGIKLAGLIALVSPAVTAGNAWALDSSQVMTVLRKGTAVTMSTDAAFGSDATQVRAVARIGFGHANPSGIVRLHAVAA
ncbi:phage major capsid protein [Rhodococcus coprophilus]|uniref:Phage capsid protein n=1 Tax=Rhodococcus coprophilus TaxID=38310 RepID=A0A2X4TZI4_9NOCA|nr:phage major capsid protein [Rhodococcus coprophilus]MBM7458575.1 HK97 family phage major capsid protein [Rhodococcus coprophilus]SQI32917.1 phage capsid protein [Rhodococcus coprophilus]